MYNQWTILFALERLHARCSGRRCRQRAYVCHSVGVKGGRHLGLGVVSARSLSEEEQRSTYDNRLDRGLISSLGDSGSRSWRCDGRWRLCDYYQRGRGVSGRCLLQASSARVTLRLDALLTVKHSTDVGKRVAVPFEGAVAVPGRVVDEFPDKAWRGSNRMGMRASTARAPRDM